jgi:hypothetical protein
MMSLEAFKEELISDGIASAQKNETRPERLRGCLIGFELCLTLHSIWDFQDELARRLEKESRWIETHEVSRDEYWEHRCATLQVEYVFERMLVAWSELGLYSGPLKARAALRAAQVIKRQQER